MAETGNIPKEVTYGILKPLQKPNKAKGPPSNLRHIILLSSLRKIPAACIPNRIKDRLKVEIPPLQAAYRPNRSTTARNESAHLKQKSNHWKFTKHNWDRWTTHHLHTSQCFTLRKMWKHSQQSIRNQHRWTTRRLCECTPLYLLPWQNAKTRKIQSTSRSSVCRTECKIKHS